MRTVEVARAVEEWAASVTGVTSSFDHPPEQLDRSLPIVIAEVQSKRRERNPENFLERAYQQVSVRTWGVDLLLLVSPDPAWTASQSLYDYVDALEASLYADNTLGSRVGFADRLVDASFDPPEIEFTDGTVARLATFTMSVGEQVGG